MRFGRVPKTLSAIPKRMPESGAPYLLDLPALKAWSDATGNEFQSVLAALNSGEVVCFNRVWEVMKEAYPDEAKKLAESQFPRLRFNREHRLAAAAIADKLEATFPVMSAYDDAVEWAVAGVAASGSYTIVSDERRIEKYAKIDGLVAISYEELLDVL
jgi:hypothetical protein